MVDGFPTNREHRTPHWYQRRVRSMKKTTRASVTPTASTTQARAFMVVSIAPAIDDGLPRSTPRESPRPSAHSSNPPSRPRSSWFEGTGHVLIELGGRLGLGLADAHAAHRAHVEGQLG